ncbi:hypothetical protein OSTOST_03747, partial [Ostertagia ostertagi]
MEEMVNELNLEGLKIGLEMNMSKTQVMVNQWCNTESRNMNNQYDFLCQKESRNMNNQYDFLCQKVRSFVEGIGKTYNEREAVCEYDDNQ